MSQDQIRQAHADGLVLCKYADPSEGKRYGLALDVALSIASQYPQLIYVITPRTYEELQQRNLI